MYPIRYSFRILHLPHVQPVQLAKKYIQYYITASNGKGHGTHSPFVFDFMENVLNDNRHFYPYDIIEILREQLLNDKSLLGY